MDCRRDEGTEDVLVVQMTSLEASVALSKRKPAQGCVGLCWLSLKHKQHSATCPGKGRLLWLEKRTVLLQAQGLELLLPRPA